MSAFCLGGAGGEALQARCAEAPGPVGRPAPLHLSVTWSTATETDVYGFVVLRADAESGPFHPVSDDVIPGAGHSDVMHHYRFDDTRVALGKTYFYALESVSLSGERRRHQGVVSKRCCDTTTAGDSPAPVTQFAPERADRRIPVVWRVGLNSRPPLQAAAHEDYSRSRLEEVSLEKERP